MGGYGYGYYHNTAPLPQQYSVPQGLSFKAYKLLGACYHPTLVR